MTLRVWRPTLVRRVFLALVIASLVIWAIMMAVNLSITLSDQRTRDEVDNLTLYLAEGLARMSSDESARAFVLGAIGETGRDAYNWRNFKSVKYQLRDRHGHVLLSNLGAAGSILIREAGKRGEARLHGQRFLVAGGETQRWSVSIALPMHNLVGVLRDDWLSLTMNIALAFPFIFIPVWIAVSRGLRPLRMLSDRIAARSADELSPIEVDPKYEEMKPLVAALDSLLLQLQRKVSREHAFVHDAAHELRTPIAVISAQAHVLGRASSVQEREAAEQQMDVAIARAGHLIHQLLDLARLDDQAATVVSEVDVAQLVRTDLAQRVQAAQERSIELSFEAPDALWFALEPQVVRSVLHNLVDNAIRYVQEGGRIEVELARAGSGLALTVADDGPGIPVEQQKLVFERFYRGAGNDASGAGLGLAIARQAAARLNGEITLQAGLDGSGCRFVLTVAQNAATRLT